MTRIDAIVAKIRQELEKRPAMLEGGGLHSLILQCYFEGDVHEPRDVIVRPEFNSRRRVERGRKRA